MKKNIIILTLILFFCNLYSVKAIQSESYTSGAIGATSAKCNSGRCISSVGIQASGYDFSGTTIFGVRVTIVNKSGVKQKEPINFWATENMKNAMTGGISLYNTSDGKMGGLNVYDSSVDLYKEGLKEIDESNYTYSDYINGLTEAQIKAYLSHFYPEILSDNIETVNSTISKIENFYIKFQPIYTLIFTCTGNSNSNCDNDAYIISGTSKELLDFGFNTTKTWPKWFFKYIVRDEKTYNGKSEFKWNVIKNYVLTTYITEKPKGSLINAYGGEDCPSIDEIKKDELSTISKINQMVLKNQCNADSGLGVGYLKISDKVIKKDPCEDELNKAYTYSDYITIYENYKNKVPSQNKNLILNFSDAKCEYQQPQISSDESCLNISKKSSISFNSNNLSNYNDTIIYAGKQQYCLTEFELKSDTWENNKTVKAGRFVLENDILATSTLTKTCYIQKKSIIGEIPNNIVNENIDYVQDYLGDLYLDNNKINSSIEDNQTLNFSYKGEEGEFYKYVSTTEIEYYTPTIYTSKMDGKIFSEKCDNCVDIGNGIISKFSDEDKKINLDFYYEDGAKNIFEFSSSGKNTCSYNVKSEITTLNKLQLELRLIDTKKPFNRKTKSNWCDGSDCSKDNDIVKKYIINSINSYGLDRDGKKHEPIYKIILDSEAIKTIRKYNETNQYNYYKLINKNGIMINAFVYDLKNGILNQYKEDSTIDYSFGTLKYKLEGTKTK